MCAFICFRERFECCLRQMLPPKNIYIYIYIGISQVTVSRIQCIHNIYTHTHTQHSGQMLERFLPTFDFVDTDSRFVSMEINAQIGVTRVTIFSNVFFYFCKFSSKDLLSFYLCENGDYANDLHTRSKAVLQTLHSH